MSKEKLTLETLPQAVELLLEKVEKLTNHISNSEQGKSSERIPLNIQQASAIIQKAVPTIYTMVRDRRLPAYKNGKRLYFFEDELISWVESGKTKTMAELQQEVSKTCK